MWTPPKDRAKKRKATVNLTVIEGKGKDRKESHKIDGKHGFILVFEAINQWESTLFENHVEWP